MKKNLFKMLLATGIMMNVASLAAWNIIEIPAIENMDPNYEFVSDVAQYKQGDWSQVIGRASNVTVEQAKKIADENPAITYFFYVKGYCMVLETTSVDARIFNYGDAVFFSGTPWWGTAPGLADGYVKKNI